MSGPHGVLVGRAAVRRRLGAVLDTATRGSGSIIALPGAAGIGKTRLCQAVVEDAESRGLVTATGRCLDLAGTSLPYLPFVEALRSLANTKAVAGLDPVPRHLSRLIPGLLAGAVDNASALAPVDKAMGQHQLLEEMLAVIDHVAGGEMTSGLLLVLEDLHCADASTLDLLAFLAGPVRSRRVAILATYREGNLAADAQLPRLIGALSRTGIGLVEPLEPLLPGDVNQLLIQSNGAPLDAALSRDIQKRAEGNPFFALELLRAAEEGRGGLPDGLRDLLLERFSQLDPVALQVLRVAAAVGRDIPPQLLANVMELPDEQLWDVLRDAVDRDILEADQQAGTYRFRHAMLAESVYEMLLPGEREGMHARLAAAILARPALAGPRTLAAELARHHHAAGQARQAFVASMQAAQQAQEVAGHGEALDHVTMVITLWDQVADASVLSHMPRWAVLAWAAELANLTGRPDAVVLARQAKAELGPHGDSVRIGLLEERIGSYALDLGDRQVGLDALARAVALIPAEPPSSERSRVLGSLGIALTLSCRFHEALAACQDALDVALAVDDQAATIKALCGKGINLGYIGRLEQGLECLQRALTSAWDRGTPSEVTRTYRMQADVLRMAGRLHESGEVTRLGLDAAASLGVVHSDGVLIATQAAQVHVALGEFKEAEEALVPTLQRGTAYWAELPLMVRGDLAVLRGEMDLAGQMIKASQRLADEPRWAPPYAGLRARFALAQREFVRSQEAVVDGLDAAPLPDTAYQRVRLLAIGIAACDGEAATARASGDAARAERAWERATAWHDQAEADAQAAEHISRDVRGWLLMADAEFARMGKTSAVSAWRAAQGRWRTLERPYQQAYCGLRLAEAMVVDGQDNAEAGLVGREALGVARTMGAEPLCQEIELLAKRARLRLVDAPLDGGLSRSNHVLTPREREVVALVAEGCTNREIAAALMISAKTASVHVSNILAKLAVSSRVEAAAVARQLNLV